MICYNCENEIGTNHHTTYDNNIICDECLANDYFICDDCGEILRSHDSYETQTQRLVCDNCVQNYGYCDNCESYVDSTTQNDEGDYLCDNCYEEYENAKEEILDYGEKVYWEKRTLHQHNPHNPHNPHLTPQDFTLPQPQPQPILFTGIELEVYNNKHEMSNNDMAREVKKFNRDIVCMYDGSIGDGFEIITQPMEKDYFYSQQIQYIFKNTLYMLKDNGFTSHNAETCGLHIHINRDIFDEDHIDRLIYFFEIYKNELIIFSRRTKDKIDRWSRFITDYHNDTLNKKDITLDYVKKNKTYSNRYMAVNISNCKNTIEIRLWRGTLNYDTFLATYNLTIKIVEWALSNKRLPKKFEDIFGNDNIIKTYYDGRLKNVYNND